MDGCGLLSTQRAFINTTKLLVPSFTSEVWRLKTLDEISIQNLTGQRDRGGNLFIFSRKFYGNFNNKMIRKSFSFTPFITLPPQSLSIKPTAHPSSSESSFIITRKSPQRASFFSSPVMAREIETSKQTLSLLYSATTKNLISCCNFTASLSALGKLPVRLATRVL